MLHPELEKIGLKPDDKVLIFGIGNIGRQDDGLGVRLIEKLQTMKFPDQIALEANYQLNAEDALLISGFDVVIFVDAAFAGESEPPFSVRVVEAAHEITFTTHAMSVDSVVALCADLYAKFPRVYLMTIPGYEWNIQDRLTEGASRNLAKAFQALRRAVGTTSQVGCLDG